MHTYCGIDGGLSGAIACIRPNNTKVDIEIFDMPVMATKTGKKTKREYDEHRIRDILAREMALNSNGVIVALEQAQPYPGQGAVSNFTTGYCLGLIKGLLCALRVPFRVVYPKTWQKAFFTNKAGEAKKCAYQAASRLFPDVKFKTPRGKIKDGQADAALLALFSKLTFGNSSQP